LMITEKIILNIQP